MAFFYNENGLTLSKLGATSLFDRKKLKELQLLRMEEMQIELNLDKLIFKNGDGKPLLKNNRYVSISHDINLCGIYISDSPCGLDIQSVHEKIEAIKSKFCSPSELRWANSLEDLTTIWCIKECIFKVFGTQVPFSKSIETEQFATNAETITAHYSGVHGSHKFQLRRMQVDSTFVVTTELKI